MKPLTTLETKVAIALMLGFNVKEAAWACGLTYHRAWCVKWRGWRKLKQGAKILTHRNNSNQNYETRSKHHNAPAR